MWELMNKLMLSCQQATGLMAARSFRKLSFQERLQLLMHKMACHQCRKFDVQSKYIDHSMEKWFDTSYIHPTEHISDNKISELKDTVYQHTSNQ